MPIVVSMTVLLLCGSFLFGVPKASAYGGGFPGFPPGWFHKPKNHCEVRAIHLPFGRSITVPDCKKEKEKEKEKKKEEFKHRVREFLRRIHSGR